MSTRSLPLFRGTALIALVVAVAGLFAVGCSETRSEGTATGLGALSESIAGTRTEINRTTGSLQKLKAGGDLKAAYQEFSGNIDATKKSAASVKSAYESMQAQAETYVTNWKKEIEEVQDPALKATANARSSKVKEAVASITTSLEEAKKSYEALTGVLGDLNKVIGNDVTPDGVKAATPTIDKAIAQSIDVQGKLTKVSEQLDSVRGTLTPTGK